MDKVILIKYGELSTRKVIVIFLLGLYMII